MPTPKKLIEIYNVILDSQIENLQDRLNNNSNLKREFLKLNYKKS
jgi:hypothetical protein